MIHKLKRYVLSSIHCEFKQDLTSKDTIRIIMQYLRDENYNLTVNTIQDEANVKRAERKRRKGLTLAIKKAILGF